MSSPEPLVLVPGLNCTGALFAPQLGVLGHDRALIIPDTRNDATLTQVARRALLAAPPRFALCGLSMGGYIAFEILRLAPGRVTRLALLDTRASSDTPEDGERRERLARWADEGRFEEVHPVLWPRLVHPRHLADQTLQGVVLGMARDTGAAAFARQQRAAKNRPDYRPWLRDITVPTLVLVGEEDVITPPKDAREMAEGIAGARLVIVPECGHLSTLEAPAAVNAALLEWLAL